MTLDKAIEILEVLEHDNPFPSLADEFNALKLAIEALKTIKMFRKFADDDNIGRLPGEKKE